MCATSVVAPLLVLFGLLATQAFAQPGFDVRMQQEAGAKELRVSLALHGTEAFGLGDAVVAIASSCGWVYCC